jgi:DNA-binding transcriptional regulator YiaG
MSDRIYRSEAFKEKQKMREESQRMKQQMAVRFVKDNPDISKTEIAKRFGVSWMTLKKWLEA